ncbi:hypothetical protein H5410_004681 [Solanum commersonii]|uniref:J domain-containing protein n=2 Tax=Solanum commersonii TaxID=4109 RepID=A0A9J6B8U6_SOLCO|nr:hypothetical protein H5410_004681 [Solanum commersonii]
MDGNKDEALKCISIAKEAIVSGNKKKALKYIGIACRLDSKLDVNDLLVACEKLDASTYDHPTEIIGDVSTEKHVKSDEERNYTEEHMHLITQIKRIKDYYAILGLEKSCSVEEIRKAYRKLSLKVHPDKNKAPGSEEAFKKVSKAFKCLSDDDSRRHYDETGLVEEFEFNQQHNLRRRRRRMDHDFFEDDFDDDEIIRAFFGQSEMFRTSYVYRSRTNVRHQRENLGSSGPNLILLLQMLPFFIIFLLAYFPFSAPQYYSLQKNYSYQFKKMTDKYGVEFFVKSAEFDKNYPLCSPARENIEDNVIRDHKSTLGRYCHIELQRRQWNRNYPTPHCDRLQNFGVA